MSIRSELSDMLYDFCCWYLSGRVRTNRETKLQAEVTHLKTELESAKRMIAFLEVQGEVEVAT